jgi:hypothetical protein
MPKKDAKIKRTRAKAKNVIQKVVVNVGGRGGGGRKSTAPSQPPRPTPLQQATQFLQATQSRPQQGESMIQSAQVLQRLLDPINMRLEAIIRQRQEVPAINMPPISITNPAINMPPINMPAINMPPINMPPINMPPISITNPPINIRQPDIFVAPPNVSINQRFPDLFRRAEGQEPRSGYDININQPFPNMDQRRDHNRPYVADLPDDPLVQPNAPLVLAGPMRMDDPHEDVPLEKLDPALAEDSRSALVALGKQEAKEVPIEVAMKEKEKESELRKVGGESAFEKITSASDRFLSIPLTIPSLDKLIFRRKANTAPNAVTLIELASYYSLPLPKAVLEKGKSEVIKYLIANKAVR